MNRIDERAQSEPLGVALLLGLTILGTTAVVAFGGAALTDAQEHSQLARAEQSMTLFDSQAAQVALGNSDVQHVDFGVGDGTYSVNPSAGEISIVQLDCDDNGTNDDGNNAGGGADGADLSTDDDAYILPPTALGEVTYRTSEGTLAYQGGGVWQKSRSGGVGMVSPPEFHYREATLTFPVVLTRGGGGASGSATATVTSPTDPVRVFADASESFPTRCGGTSFSNPVTDGTVIVRIESEYARGWGEYFESRTDGIITYPSDDVVLIELVSLGQIGDFGMPGDGSSVTVSGASSAHSTEEFVITLKPDTSDSAQFNNLQWSMYVEEGKQRFEMHLKKGSGGDGDCSDGTTDLKVDLTIYYSPDGGTTYYGWQANDAYSAECENYDTSDPEEEIKLVADFIDDEDGNDDAGSVKPWTDVEPGDPELEYVGKDNMNSLVHFGISGSDTAPSSYTIDGHGGTDTWEPTTYSKNSGDRETVDRLVNHYFAELPMEFQLTVDDKGSNTVSEAGSSGTLMTGGSGRYVTYLHVTTNEIEVEIED